MSQWAKGKVIALSSSRRFGKHFLSRYREFDLCLLHSGEQFTARRHCWRKTVSDLNAASPRRNRNLCGIVTLSPRSPCDCVRVYLLFSRHEKQRERERGRRLCGFEDLLILLCVNNMNQLAEDNIASDGKQGRGGIFPLFSCPATATQSLYLTTIFALSQLNL